MKRLTQTAIATLLALGVAGARDSKPSRESVLLINNRVGETVAPTAEVTQRIGFVSLTLIDDTITSLRFDGAGKSSYGMETIAVGGGLRGVGTVGLTNNVLVIQPKAKHIEWDIPFRKTGYYDADVHLHYPHDTDTNDATRLVLPFECFTSSAGHYLRIEHFKHLAEGLHWSWINLENGRALLMRSDATQNWDLEVSVPGCERAGFDPKPDRLIFKSGVLTGPLRITVLPRGTHHMPENKFLMPAAKFSPDTPITFALTGKTLPISRVMTEFLRMGIFWNAEAQCSGEWVLDSELYFNNDPRSWYLRQLRKELLVDQGWMGYDRFGHFGYQFAWDRYPDYGAGGWRNVPPGNAPNDMRMLHINGMRALVLVRYVLATGDRDFLRARRARTVWTDGTEPQPICGAGADTQDYVLAPGDVSYDGRTLANKHSLGQEFTAATPFTIVRTRLGNPSAKETNAGRLALYDRRGGALIAETKVSLRPNVSEEVPLAVGKTLPAGRYYLELTDDDSGNRYFGPGLIWWTNVDANYKGGDAYSGPFHGDVAGYIQTLFDYLYEFMGAKKDNLISYANDREFNVPDQRSGIHKKCQANSYWEGAGGAYDSYIALWYNAACSAMADLREFEGDSAGAARYRQLRTLADDAYNRMFWHTATDNGRTWRRYFACKDWAGAIHDYGYTYNNLEAAARDIPTPTQVRDILRWLDRGQYAPDPAHKIWRDHIYSIWEMHAPFSTLDNHDWLPVSSTLDYMSVVSNGGGRLETSARDLWVRAKYLSADNMHERNERILARFISPDRLTGGRTNPHWIGRWFFLGPPIQIADIEGFREIFPGSGLAASCQPLCYFGMDFTPAGLALRPRVPSEYESVEFDNIGYWGAVFNFKAEAKRRDVLDIAGNVRLTASGEIAQTFTAPSAFNRAGVRVAVEPFKNRSYNGLTLALEQREGTTWTPVAENWYNHVQDSRQLWVDARRMLTPGVYRLRITDACPTTGERINLWHDPTNTSAGSELVANSQSVRGCLALRLVDERTSVTVETVFNPKNIPFSLAGSSQSVTATTNGLLRLSATIAPDEKLLLKPN